jgi:SagB-type dehydrogenase family enzyme
MKQSDSIQLPPPDTGEPGSFERAVAKRRTVRDFSKRSLSLDQISQICWAAQGITHKREGLRSSPSAGALYPIEIYLATDEGVHHYEPKSHCLRQHLEEDVRPLLQRASWDQEMITEAPVCVVIAAVVSRVAADYGSRAERYSLIEVGHVGQNVLLQAEALGLSGVPIGACDDRSVVSALKLPKGQKVYYLIPIGYRKRG